MPSSRAVLADIKELSLDPSKSYTTVSSAGRLKHVNKQEQLQEVTEEITVPTLVVATDELKVDNEITEPVMEEKVLEKKDKKLKKKLSSESESS